MSQMGGGLSLNMTIEDNISGLMNRRGIVDLPLLRRLLAIHQKS